MMLKLTLKEPDTLGVLASVLCFVHCLATPLLFVSQVGIASAGNLRPNWWGSLDYFFIAISFIAIYLATKKSVNANVNFMLWGLWAMLLSLILNEKMELFKFPEVISYVVAISLALLHAYNLKYCQCSHQKCCVKNG